jgi:hypothetical protein
MATPHDALEQRHAGVAGGTRIWEFRRRNQCYLGNFESPRVLLSVVGQHLIAAGGEFGAVLLQARQNGEIALIHQRAAKTLDVARARLLLLWRTTSLLLGEGAGGNCYGQQQEPKENFLHGVLSF